MKLSNATLVNLKQVKLLNDGSTCNDNRLGAVACIELAVSTFNITDDLIVIGG